MPAVLLVLATALGGIQLAGLQLRAPGCGGRLRPRARPGRSGVDRPAATTGPGAGSDPHRDDARRRGVRAAVRRTRVADRARRHPGRGDELRPRRCPMMTCPVQNSRAEVGAGSILALAVVAAAVVLALAMVALGAGLAVRQRTIAAADAAALAAADVLLGAAPGDPCTVASSIADRNGAVLAELRIGRLRRHRDGQFTAGRSADPRPIHGGAGVCAVKHTSGGGVYGVALTEGSKVPASKKLVIVESPAKAKTIAQYLGEGYEVQASVGHIRDLIEPKNLPPELKKGSLGKFSIDVENGFAPYYVVNDDKKKTVAELKRALKDADELYLATDEDREGEAIAWHLLEVLKPTIPVKRMVFHEITKEAIQEAQSHTRDIDIDLVDAQETRRILDRLYGFEVSPVLWRKVGPGLSAGRVQSAATRLVVDRERERLAFVSALVLGSDRRALARGHRDPVHVQARPPRRPARRQRPRLRRPRRAQGRRRRARRGCRRSASRTRCGMPGTVFEVASVEIEAVHPPTGRSVHDLDPAAGGRAQAALLGPPDHERRAGAVRERATSPICVPTRPRSRSRRSQAARAQATKLYGAESLLAAAAPVHRQVEERAGGPRGDPPVRRGLPHAVRAREHPSRQRGQAVRPDLEAHGRLADGRREGLDGIRHDRRRRPSRRARAEFTASGTVITFRGFLAAYEEGHDEERNAERRGRREAASAQGGPDLDLGAAGGEGSRDLGSAALHRGQPGQGPRRARDRPPVDLRVDHLHDHRPRLRDPARHRRSCRTGSRSAWSGCSKSTSATWSSTTSPPRWRTTSTASPTARPTAPSGSPGWYFGGDRHRGLRQVVDNLGEIDAREINSVPDRRRHHAAHRPLRPVPRGRRPRTRRRPRRVNVPDDMAPDELTPAKARELIDAPVTGDRELGVNPGTGKMVVAKDGRYGPYVHRARAGRAGGSRAGRHRGLARRPGDRRGRRGQAEEEEGREGRRVQAAHGIPLLLDGSGDGRPRDRDPPARPPACGRQRPGERRADHGPERPLRRLPQEGHRQPLARQRGPDLLDRAARRPSRSSRSRSTALAVRRAR